MLLSISRKKTFPFICIKHIEEPDINYLHELYDVAGIACRAAINSRVGEGLLLCLEAKLITSNFGDKDYEVVFEVADPDDTALRRFLRLFMAHRGYYDAEIVMIGPND